MGSDRPVVAANTRRYLSRVAEFDLVHLHNLHGYYLDAIGFLNGLDRPFVWTLHDSWAVTGRCALALDCDRWHTAGCSPCPDLKQNPGTWWLDRAGRDLIERREAIANLLRRQRGYLVAPSRWLAERIIQSGVDPARVKVIPNPVDTDVFRPIADRRTLRPELGLPVEPSLILCFAARLDDTVKGGRELHQLIERFRGDQDKHFVLIGSAGKELRGPNCTALGYIGSPERLAKIYAACDLFVSTSRTESFSLCAAEAMSAGTPVVGFRVAALPELVISETGRLIAAGDVEALACEIDALLAKDGQAALQAMSRAARSRSLETWSAPRVLDQYDALYRELLDPTNTESRAA
jgi:glycosyltransferase involved in cell wall biosynthesis